MSIYVAPMELKFFNLYDSNKMKKSMNTVHCS